MKIIYQTILQLVILTFVAACNTSKPQEVMKNTTLPPLWEEASRFGPSPEIIATESLFELSAEQKADFMSFIKLPENSSRKANRVVSDYLQSHLSDFNYYSETLRAKDSLIKQQGNCLSLAILTTTLAKLANVNILYQLVESEPIFQKEKNVIITSQHVRSVLLNSTQSIKPGEIFLSRNNITIDYFPERGTYVLRRVEENEFYAMYFNNKATEAFIKNDIDQAYWLTRRTLELNPSDSIGINLMALIYHEKKMYKQAEVLYLFGIDKNENKMTLLANYLLLLRKLGKHKEADEVALQLEKYQDQNPFKWISLASEAYNERAFEQALKYYRKAKLLAPYLHQIYAGIAQIKFQLGDLKSAKNQMTKALEKAYRKETKKRYQTQLDILAGLLKSNRK